MITNRIDEALRLRGMKRIELSELTKINKSSISSYCCQRWQPKQEALHKMALVLDVSELWLAGYDVPMERPLEQKKMDLLNENLAKLKTNERYADLLDCILNLNDDQFSLIESMVKQMR